MRFLKAEKKFTNSQKKLLQILILCESEKELFSGAFVSLLPVLVSFCKNGVKTAEKEEKLAKSRTNLYKTGVKRTENVIADCHTNFHLYHYAGNNPVRYIDPNGREDDYFTSTSEYVVTPNGSLIRYNTDGTYETIRTDINSDENDPTRQNEVFLFSEDLYLTE